MRADAPQAFAGNPELRIDGGMRQLEGLSLVVGLAVMQALRDVGGWRQSYGVLSDYAMYLEMLQRANIHVIEEPLTHTRITGKNMSTKFVISANWRIISTSPPRATTCCPII